MEIPQFTKLPTKLYVVGVTLSLVALPLGLWPLVVVGAAYCMPALAPVRVLHRLFPASEELDARNTLALWLVGASVLLAVVASFFLAVQ